MSLQFVKKSSRTNKKYQAFWVCRCDCGRLIEVRADTVQRETTSRCSICHGAGRPSIFVGEGEINDNKI